MGKWQRGWQAEEAAKAYLHAQGYQVLAHRYRTPHGEIDVVALQAETLIFVEVKHRRDHDKGLYAITPRQQQRIQNAALHFIAEHGAYAAYSLRFDAIIAKADKSLYHLQNAWEDVTCA
jgi:putative endonuclease